MYEDGISDECQCTQTPQATTTRSRIRYALGCVRLLAAFPRSEWTVASDPVLQSGESKREPRLGWIVSPTLSLVLYLAAVLLYGYSTKLQLADESPWSTAAFVSVALYAGLIVAPWFVWRGIR